MGNQVGTKVRLAVGTISKAGEGNKGKGRVSAIATLYKTKHGRDRKKKLMLMLASGCSMKASAAVIRVMPKTLSRWIKRGKEEEEGYYRAFWDEVVESTSAAVCRAEMEVAAQEPKFFLTRGFGRVITGDLYNIESKGENVYNLDGTISNKQSNLSLEEEETVSADDSNDHNKQKQIDHNNILLALQHLADSGVDLNEFIKTEVKKIEGE